VYCKLTWSLALAFCSLHRNRAKGLLKTCLFMVM
jgi:hypothetical protein